MFKIEINTEVAARKIIRIGFDHEALGKLVEKGKEFWTVLEPLMEEYVLPLLGTTLRDQREKKLADLEKSLSLLDGLSEKRRNEPDIQKLRTSALEQIASLKSKLNPMPT